MVWWGEAASASHLCSCGRAGATNVPLPAESGRPSMAGGTKNNVPKGMDGPRFSSPFPAPALEAPEPGVAGRREGGSCPQLQQQRPVLSCSCAVTSRDPTQVQCCCRHVPVPDCGCRCAHGLLTSSPSLLHPELPEMPRGGADPTVGSWGGTCPAVPVTFHVSRGRGSVDGGLQLVLQTSPRPGGLPGATRPPTGCGPG